MGLRAMWLALALALAGCPSGAVDKKVEGPGSGGGVGDGDSGEGDGDGEGGGEGGSGGLDDERETDGVEMPADIADGDDVVARDEDKSISGKLEAKKKRPSKGRVLEVAELERTAAVERSDKARADLVAPHLAQARAALRAGELDRAVGAARRALTIDGGHVGAIEVLAASYYRKGWLTKAERVLVTATASSPGADEPRLWMLRGLVADAQKRPLTDVRDAYQRATSLAPRYAKAWNNLGVVYLRLQKYSLSIAAFETALANDKDSTLVLTNVGTAYRRHASEARREGQRDELLRKAERAYRSAIAIDEDYAPAYLNLGVLYLDAPSFPKMTDEQRLTTAQSYLREFKQRGAQARAEDGSPIAVDAYLDAARKQLEALGQSKRVEEKRKRGAGGGS